MNCLDKCLIGTVVNWALPSLNRGLFEITFTVPSIKKLWKTSLCPKSSQSPLLGSSKSKVHTFNTLKKGTKTNQ